MPDKIFVTGIGIISSIGKNIEETLLHFRSAKSGIGPITRMDTVHKNSLPVAEVKLSNAELKQLLKLNSSDKIYSRTALLGMVAAAQALKSAGITNVSEMRTGIISANSVGGMDLTEQFYESFLKDNESGNASVVTAHDCGDSTEKIADFLGITEYVSTISTACSSSANSIMLGARLIKNGVLDRVLVGGTDALTRFTLNGFNTLMIFDKNECRPFDAERNGLNLGEGAGYLVLESEKSVLATQKKVLGMLSGYANANDAYHQTASSPDGNGAFLAMQQALELSGLLPEHIDYINVHGTATQNNDLSEGIAMKRIFGEKIPPFSSTKSFTGHTLGAAGGIEAVFSILALQEQIIYPNLRFKTPIAELNISPVTTFLENVSIKNILSNSFGFGGNNSTLIFSAA
ncbi:MAG: beta-ketoacyl-[acyl-carrier-protein] synthase family protein [Bacteroidetes bacterium]|nr:beta-ketoacyl-[acyl-carrier-protein] synthase family protein [Bacteroidota bacterium]